MPIPTLRLVVVIVALAAAAGAAAESPAIFWASSPIRPNETVLIAGHALVAPESDGPVTTVELAVLDGPPRSPPPHLVTGGRGYRIESSREIVFEHNTVEGFGLTAIGNDIATFWSNACTHIFFSGNRLRRMFGADREMMTLDAGGGAYRGGVASAEGIRLTLAADPVFKDYAPRDYAPRPHQNWTGACVAILAGRGVGQYRLVTGHEGRDWEIDGKGRSVRDVVFRRNTCESNASIDIGGNLHGAVVEHNTIEHADVGITVRPPATGVILRENTMHDVRTPLAGPGLSAATVVPDPVP